MPRLWPLLALTAALAACSGRSYTIESANISDANERAQRYCNVRDATAQLEQIHQKGNTSVETYRCVDTE